MIANDLTGNKRLFDFDLQDIFCLAVGIIMISIIFFLIAQKIYQGRLSCLHCKWTTDM